MNEPLADQCVIRNGAGDLEFFARGEFDGPEPRGALGLKAERDFPDVVRGGEGGRAGRKQGGDGGRQRGNGRMDLLLMRILKCACPLPSGWWGSKLATGKEGTDGLQGQDGD